MKISKRTLIYELFMLLLVILSLALLPYHNFWTILLNWVIWGIFTLDYFSRLVRAEDKKRYIKTHPFQLIAIIPLYGGFRAARIVSLFHILRLTAMGNRYLTPLFNFLKTNGLNRFILIFLLLVIFIPLPMVLIEPDIHDYPDAIWWAIVTATTVGYGDIIPITPIGRILASIMMLVGIGFIGMITSTIMSYASKQRKISTSSEKISHITKAIDQVEELDEKEIAVLESYLDMKKKK
ncbi:MULTISPECIES: potassium channel family protein [Listeria]|uniref:potassium channel family protein n=1 Tax=Listeria TaxID=1637 RepID=UPI000B588016|nr:MULTISPECIES: potassium channel family protein [Listeria]